VRRGDLYRVDRPGAGDPKRSRVFVVVSRQAVIDSRFSTVICAPVYTERYGLSTEVAIGAEQGLEHDCSIHCDALVSVQKSLLTRFVGMLAPTKLLELDHAIAAAGDLDLDVLCAERAQR
jgi:mRNA interferase MazF